MISKNTVESQMKKFGTCDHQSLEFYGDRVLSEVMALITYDLFKLKMSPGFLSKLLDYLTNNRMLTDIMLNKDACKFVRTTYNIIDTRARFHNACADSLEALIGALFVHLYSHNLNYLIFIRDWLMKNTSIPFIIQEYLYNNGINDIAIFIPTDKTTAIKQAANNKLLMLSNLETLRDSMGEEKYWSVRQRIETRLTNPNEFTTKSLIVQPTTPLSHIYQLLGWNYEEPKYYPGYGVHLIMGFSGGQRITIGEGKNKRDAKEYARNYLLLTGHIINMTPITRFYS